MSDLVEFLRARLDEDEQVANLASAVLGEIVEDIFVSEHDAAFFKRFDPARVLADVEFKRRVVDLHGADPHECVAWDESLGVTCTCYEVDCPTLRLFALPYADHADYDKGWAV